MVKNQAYTIFSNTKHVDEIDSVTSFIEANVRITGTVLSDGLVVCAGHIEGTVECNSLDILPGGKLIGDVNAKFVTINGTMSGIVKAETVELAKHADFNGELCCDSIAVEKGAKIEASLNKEQAKDG